MRLRVFLLTAAYVVPFVAGTVGLGVGLGRLAAMAGPSELDRCIGQLDMLSDGLDPLLYTPEGPNDLQLCRAIVAELEG